jgi:hypothetical protein
MEVVGEVGEEAADLLGLEAGDEAVCLLDLEATQEGDVDGLVDHDEGGPPVLALKAI